MSEPIHCPICQYVALASFKFCPVCGFGFRGGEADSKARETFSPYFQLNIRLDDVLRRLDNLEKSATAPKPAIQFEDFLVAQAQVLETPEQGALPSPAADEFVEEPSLLPVASSRMPVAEPITRGRERSPSREASEYLRKEPSLPPVIPGEPTWKPDSTRSIEELISGRGLPIVGGLAMIVGAIFFLSLAFSRGWISPGLRVIIGLIVSSVMVVGGYRFFGRTERTTGHALVASGLGIAMLSIVAATRLFDLISPEIGMVGSLTISIVAAALAIRFNLQIVATYGIIFILAAPPIMGAEPSGVSILLIATALVGSTLISVFKNWGWLTPVAFVISAPQLLYWLDSETSLLLAGLAATGFWALNIAAVSGEHLRIPELPLGRSTAWVVIVNALLPFAIVALLSDNGVLGDRFRGLAVGLIAVGHLAVGGHFIKRDGIGSAFGILVTGTGVGAFAAAVPIQFGGRWVLIGWTSQMTAMAFVWTRTQVRAAAIWTAILAILCSLTLIVDVYPMGELSGRARNGVPFLNAEGATFGYLLVAMTVVSWLLGHGRARVFTVGIAALLTIYVIPFELVEFGRISGWSVVAILTSCLTGSQFLSRADQTLILNPLFTGLTSAVDIVSRYTYRFAESTAQGLTGFTILSVILPLDEIGSSQPEDWPFLNVPTLSVAIAVIALGTSWWYAIRADTRLIFAGIAIAELIYLTPFQLTNGPTILVWAGISLIPIFIAIRPHENRRYYEGMAWIVLTLATVVALATVATPDRLYVDRETQIDWLPFVTWGTVCFLAIALVLAIHVRRQTNAQHSRTFGFIAAANVVYSCSIGVVDLFQNQVGDGATLRSLQKQAQVTLSIFWALLGGSAFVAGVMLRMAPVRLVGLGLLGAATIKVFLYDLAELDASYRVLSFIGIGILLLACSYIYQRLVGADRARQDSRDGQSG